MIRLIALPFLAIACAGCPQLGMLEGKPSETQQHVERMALLTTPEPIVEPVAFVAAVAAVAAPECSDHVFRVYRCVDGVIKDWSYE